MTYGNIVRYVKGWKLQAILHFTSCARRQCPNLYRPNPGRQRKVTLTTALTLVEVTHVKEIWRSINVNMDDSKYRARSSSWNTSLKQLILQIHLKMLEYINGPIYDNTTYFSGVKSKCVLCGKHTATAKQLLYRRITDPEGSRRLRLSDFQTIGIT